MSQTDPFERFRDVFDMACATDMVDPNAMTLATVGADGRPAARTVLLKQWDARGFVFYTNFESRKGEEILGQPDVALLFFWRDLGRQIRIEGPAAPVDDAEADAYFASRHRGSRIGAWASQQSRPVSGPEELEAAVKEMEARFPGDDVPRPPHWSGFRVVPRYFEFWTAGEFRLHDREIFELIDGAWVTRRLYP